MDWTDPLIFSTGVISFFFFEFLIVLFICFSLKILNVLATWISCLPHYMKEAVDRQLWINRACGLGVYEKRICHCLTEIFKFSVVTSNLSLLGHDEKSQSSVHLSCINCSLLSRLDTFWLVLDGSLGDPRLASTECWHQMTPPADIDWPPSSWFRLTLAVSFCSSGRFRGHTHCS